MKASGNDACLVEDKAVATFQVSRQVAESRVTDRVGGAIDDHEARSVARGNRVLRDPLGGQNEIEFIDANGGMLRKQALAPMPVAADKPGLASRAVQRIADVTVNDTVDSAQVGPKNLQRATGGSGSWRQDDAREHPPGSSVAAHVRRAD